MDRENRALLVLVVAAVVIVGVGGAFILIVNPPLPTTLPIPAGTTFTQNETMTWAAHFSVSGAGAHVVGAWEAYDGAGPILLFIVNGTVGKPLPSSLLRCLADPQWSTGNWSTDAWVGPGPHTAYWNTGYCAVASRIVVTSAIELAP